MTILSKNIRRFREQKKLTQDSLGQRLKVTASAVAQWEKVTDPTTPDIHTIYALAMEFNTTIENLVYSDDPATMPITTALNNALLLKLFSILDKNKSLNYAFEKASPRMKSYLFALLYGFVEEGVSLGQTDAEIIGYIESILTSDERTPKMSAIESQKRASSK